MEEPDRKRLKSAATQESLPAGWTEHTAPTGHKYYYHKETKKSTYTRPVTESHTISEVQYANTVPNNNVQSWPSYTNDRSGDGYLIPQAQPYPYAYPSQGHHASAQPFPQSSVDSRPPVHHQRRFHNQPQDRPKRKEAITNCDPWVLVYTRLGRRFVHNTQTGESLWKFPPDVMNAVIEHDLQLRMAKNQHLSQGTGANSVAVKHRPDRNTETSQQRTDQEQRAEDEAALAAEPDDMEAHQLAAMEGMQSTTAPGHPGSGQDSETEYEEIEVTDDEDEDDEGATNDEASDKQDQTYDELGEDDMAYQLEYMNQDQDQDQDFSAHDNGDADPTRTTRDESQTRQQATTAIFYQLLDDFEISPFTPWSSILGSPPPSQDGSHDLLSDPRFTVLPSSKLRKEAYDTWCRARIAAKRDQDASTLTHAETGQDGSKIKSNDRDDAESSSAGKQQQQQRQGADLAPPDPNDPRTQFLALLHRLTTKSLDAVEPDASSDAAGAGAGTGAAAGAGTAGAGATKPKRRLKQPTQLYWAEFKRKYKRESAMQDAPRSLVPKSKRIDDKDREEMYRSHVARVSKLSFEERCEDLRSLLRENREVLRSGMVVESEDMLPNTVTGDLRFSSLNEKDRRDVLEEFLSRLPSTEETA